MPKKSIKTAEFILFLNGISLMKDDNLRALAAAEAGKCVRKIFHKHLSGKAVSAEAKKMVKKFCKCQYCDVTDDDLANIMTIRKIIISNFS